MVAGGFPTRARQDSANPRGKTCGNLESAESALHGAVREVYEELGIVIDPEDLDFATVSHFLVNDQGFGPALAISFIARTWTGTPRICESDECKAIGWLTMTSRPIVPYVADALGRVREGIVTGSLKAGFGAYG